MSAYTTPTASVSLGGFKKSITCHTAKGVFFDLGVVSKCPHRLIAAAFADVVCRITSQVDWLMSHLFFDTGLPTDEIRARFGAQAGEMIEQTRHKALNAAKADALNQRLQKEWPKIAGQLRAVMLPYQKLHDAMQIAGCPLTGADLGLQPEFYRDAIRHARFIRDRFSMLDVAGDSGQLDTFAENCQ